MKHFNTAIFLLSTTALMAAGCGDDDSSSTLASKCEIDGSTLSTSGVNVTLSGSVGSLVVPLTEPLAAEFVGDSSYDGLVAALDGKVSLTVSSDETGTSASLTDGTAVSGAPSSAGEFTWNASSGNAVTLTFFNEVNGLTLKNDRGYTASLTVNTNDACERLSMTSVPVTVSGN
jgi:hypothetical protein